MASIPGNPFIDLCAENARATFLRHQAAAARQARWAREARRLTRLREMAEGGILRELARDLRFAPHLEDLE